VETECETWHSLFDDCFPSWTSTPYYPGKQQQKVEAIAQAKDDTIAGELDQADESGSPPFPAEIV
jgi:hypothetical protein